MTTKFTRAPLLTSDKFRQWLGVKEDQANIDTDKILAENGQPLLTESLEFLLTET